jgi:hypothetical protein
MSSAAVFIRLSAPRMAAAMLGAAAAAWPAALAAQHIAIRTVPVPTGEQFAIFPSLTMGMADVRIAVDDPWLDPFANPARGSLVEQPRLHVLPTFYGEKNDWVAGRSLPLAIVIPGQRVFGSAAFALQQLSDERRTPWLPEPDGSVIRDNSASNVHAFGSIGARLAPSTAIGFSAYFADLDAVDGVNMLYGNSVAIEQSGELTEFRFGALHHFGGGRRLDAVVLRSSTDMEHNVHYARWTGQWQPETWAELNEDRTIAWAAQLRYAQPLNETASIGLMVAGNTKAHPKIPNYDIVSIPRDPGNSAMFNIGVGISNRNGPALFGADIMYEPGRSHTWAYADTATATPTGTIPAGGKTVDNQFRFGSWTLGVGLQWEGPKAGFQAGVRLRDTRYTLEQENFLTETKRRTRESWMEWSPSWSGVVRFAEFDLRYTGRFTAKGWPDAQGQWGWGWGTGLRALASAPPGSVDFLVGPTGPVWLPEYRVTTHRLMLSVPFGP